MANACSVCGIRDETPNLKFCGTCGNPFRSNEYNNIEIPVPSIQNPICESCGRQNESNSKFCIQCGDELKVNKLEETNRQIDSIKSSFKMVGFIESIKLGFTGYFDFSGRSTRSEFWWFTLFRFLFAFCLAIIEMIVVYVFAGIEAGDAYVDAEAYVTYWLWIIATIIPHFSVGVRRLHDANHTGTWLFIGFVPLIGLIILLIMFCEGSQEGNNQYGPDPRPTK